MARDEMARGQDQETSLLDRRDYLRLTGAAAASVASFGTASATSSEEILLHDDFGTEGYTDKFTDAWRQGEYDERVSAPVKSGDKSLCLHLPEDSHYGISTTYDPVEAGDADSELTELYASYWVRFSPNFEADGNISKLPGPGNNEPGGGKGGDPSNGTNGWSARGGFTDEGGDVAIGYYCYHMDMSGSYGDYFHADTVPRDEWVKVDQHIKLNTVSGGTANSDGQLKMWVNGNLQVDKSGMRFTEDLSLGCNYKFNVRFGGNDPSPKDQAIYLDSWALSDSQLVDVSGDEQGNRHRILELITSDGMPTTDYQFTVEGNVRKRLYAGRVSSESNDSITDNGDGTMTVTGAVGNGYGDSYYVDGTIRSMSDLNESKWTLRYDNEEVSVDDLVEPYGPNIDRFDVNKSEQLGDGRMFSVQWAVSAADEELDSVEVVASETDNDLNFTVNDASGENASGWDLFQFPVGTELNVTLRVKDAADNVTKETKNITL
jgi:hypothetical protein